MLLCLVRLTPSASLSASATCRLNAGPEGEEKAREEFLEEKRRIEQENMACLQAMRAQSFRKVLLERCI